MNWISMASGVCVSILVGLWFEEKGIKEDGCLRWLTVWMTDNASDLGLTTGSYFTVETLEKVQSTTPEFPSPSLVSKAVVPEVVSGEGRKGVGRVTHEAACSVGVETEKEGNKQVVSVPECFKGLLADLGVCSRVHQQHAEKHDVACDTSGFLVVNMKGDFWTDLSLFDVEETGSR